MNNAFFAHETVRLTLEEELRPKKEQLRQRESELVRIIEALQAVQKEDAWSSLKQLVFDPLTDNLSRRLTLEARGNQPDPLRLVKLSGELKMSERFSDLSKLEKEFRVELASIKQQLYGTREPDGTDEEADRPTS